MACMTNNAHHPGRLRFTALRWFDLRHGSTDVAAILFAPDNGPSHQDHRNQDERNCHCAARAHHDPAHQDAAVVDTMPSHPTVTGDIQRQQSSVPMHRLAPSARSSAASQPGDAG